jgi:malonate-semialdehyde dehydrogenase (acetylating)/methylmalonate-semialdehyde dehydrogenase
MDLIRHHVAGQSVGSPSAPGPSTTPRPVPCRPRWPSPRPPRRAAIAAAAALPAWRATSLIKRADVFFRLRHLLVERADELAAIITAEHGKVLSDAKGEISRGIENVEFAAGLVHLLKGEHAEQVSRGVDVHSVKQPVGVVGAITRSTSR